MKMAEKIDVSRFGIGTVRMNAMTSSPKNITPHYVQRF